MQYKKLLTAFITTSLFFISVVPSYAENPYLAGDNQAYTLNLQDTTGSAGKTDDTVEVQKIKPVTATGGIRNGMVAYDDQSGKITADQKKITIDLGQSANLKFSGVDAGARDISYASNKPATVQVDADGNVYAIRTGSATITAWYNGKKARTRVKVRKSKENGSQNFIETYTGNGRKAQTLKVKGAKKKELVQSSNEMTETVVTSAGDTVEETKNVISVTSKYGTVSYDSYVECPKAVETAITIGVGETKTLKTSGVVEGIIWKNNKKKFARVDSLGRITGIQVKKNGKPVKIKVTGKVGKIKLRYTVTVDPDKTPDADPDVVANEVRLAKGVIASLSPGGRILGTKTGTDQEKKEKYSLNYDLNDSDSEYKALLDTDMNEYSADNVGTKLPVPIRKGYSFEGWEYTNEDGNSHVIKTIPEGITGNLELVAQWKADTFTVEFNANGGKVETASKEVEFAGKYGELPVPEKTGYKFDGWFTEKTDGDKVSSDTKVDITSAQELYAHWTGNVYTVNFDTNSGTGSVDSVSKTYGTDTYLSSEGLTAPVVTGHTYKFVEWNTKADGTGTGYTTTMNSDLCTEDGGNVILYAIWEDAANTYMVTLDNQSATTTGTTSVTARYGKKISDITVPAKTGYRFDGYYTEKTGGTKYINADGTGAKEWNLTELTTLYAHWTAKSTTVSTACIVPSLSTSSVGDYISYNDDKLTTSEVITEYTTKVGTEYTVTAPELEGFTLVGMTTTNNTDIEKINDAVGTSMQKVISANKAGSSTKSRTFTVKDKNDVTVFVYARKQYDLAVSTNCLKIKCSSLSSNEAGGWYDKALFGETVDLSKYSDMLVQDGYEFDSLSFNGVTVTEPVVVKGNGTVITNMHPVTSTTTVRQMGLGWNLGKTFGISTLAGRQNWDDIKARIDSAYAAGFTNIRVQTTLGYYMNDDCTAMADGQQEWWELYKKTVKYVTDKGMYCIIGDTSLGDLGRRRWDLSEVQSTEFQTEYTNMWKFLLSEFEEYDYHLVIQPYNEPCNWEGDVSGYGYSDYASNPSDGRQDPYYFAGRCDNLKNIMTVNSIFAKTMKQYAPDRIYMVGSYNGSPYSAFYNYFPKTYENWNDQYVNYDIYGNTQWKTFWYPKDVDQDKAIYFCHIYEYGDDFIGTNYEYTQYPFDASADPSGGIKVLQNKFKSDGINLPIYVDENGCGRDNMLQDAYIDGLIKNVEYMTESGMSGLALWDDTQSMSFMNYGTWDWHNEDLIKKLIKAAGQSPRTE